MRTPRPASPSSAARLFACALLLGAGCTRFYDPCFPPPSIVNDLRVLAVRAEPPEAFFDPQTGVVDPVRVTTLVVDPDPSHVPVEVSAQLCVPGTDRGCSDTPMALPFSTALPDPASFDLLAPPDRLQAAVDLDALHGYGGVRLQVDLAVPGQTGTVRASKLLLYTPRADGRAVDHQPNHGLEVHGLRVLRADGTSQDLGTDDVIQLQVGQTVGLRPLIGPAAGAQDAAESYEVTDLSGRRVRLREQISYSFFTTPHASFGDLTQGVGAYADLSADVADEPLPGTPDPAMGLVHYTPLNQTSARVWVVARDGRGAEAWSSIKVLISDLREGRRAQLEFGCE